MKVRGNAGIQVFYMLQSLLQHRHLSIFSIQILTYYLFLILTYPPAPFPWQGKGAFCKRGGEAPSQNLFPLSFKGEGDKGGEVTSPYIGIFPCFLTGLLSFLSLKASKAAMTFARVSLGCITALMYPILAATYGL